MATLNNVLLQSFIEERKSLKVIAEQEGYNTIKTLFLQNYDVRVPLFGISKEQLTELSIDIIEDREGLTVVGDGWVTFATFNNAGFNLTGHLNKDDSWMEYGC